MSLKRKHKRYSARDDALLHEYFPRLPTKDVALLLKRTPASVSVRACQLRLKKSGDLQSRRAATPPTTRRAPGTHINGGKLWTKPAIAALRRLYPTTPGVQIAEQLGRRVSTIYAMANKLCLKKDPELVREQSRQAMKNPNHGGRKHCFPKGHVPKNKGKKGYHVGGRAVLTQFKPGQKPHTTLPIGTVRAGKDGYLCIKIDDQGYHPKDWRPLHQLIWISTNGPIPAGHLVTFKDGNKRNFAETNLVLMSMADNARRNSIHNLPKPLVQAIQLNGALKRQINRRTKDEQHHRKPA